MERVITIGSPYLEDAENGYVRLASNVTIDGEVRKLWFSVEKKFERFLCYERCDAFLLALYPVAFRGKLNIVCQAPVGERLLYQLRTYLIPLIAKYGKDAHLVKIVADNDEKILDCMSAVGTGISCGVDSMHVLANHVNSKYKSLSLTHLLLNNVGAFGACEKRESFLLSIERAKRICRELNLELVTVDSNVFDPTLLDFANNCSYLNVAPVLALQKLWSVFFYGSGGDDFEEIFTLRNCDEHNAEDIDMVIFDSVSTPALRFYSEGLAVRRYEKTRLISTFPLAQRYLQVCVEGAERNCGHCFKCCRTLLTLDALGCLDAFQKVFDIEKYKAKRHWYLRYLYTAKLSGGDPMLSPVYDVLSKDVTIMDKIHGCGEYVLTCMKTALKDFLRPTFLRLGLLKRQQ